MNDKDTEIPELAQFREHVEKLDDGMKNFSDLLDTLDSLSDQKKSLWREIYYNAITDRRAAYVLYNDLLSGVIGQAAQHAIHGPIMAKYIERVSRSNDQIIRLAELVAEAQAAEKATLDTNDIFDKISSTPSKSAKKK
jgi:hypothetical protein